MATLHECICNTGNTTQAWFIWRPMCFVPHSVINVMVVQPHYGNTVWSSVKIGPWHMFSCSTFPITWNIFKSPRQKKRLVMGSKMYINWLVHYWLKPWVSCLHMLVSLWPLLFTYIWNILLLLISVYRGNICTLRHTSHKRLFAAHQFHHSGGCLKGTSSHECFLLGGLAAAVHKITQLQ